ncbi:probable tubulin polyglutamylase TTLL2 [Pelobates fuscus]|uniref:probable tubulin polyglutamylase TTLL2 n=1 Tax=Pelobates fuscus TaxID=191477 RepID=UPI002FE4A492
MSYAQGPAMANGDEEDNASSPLVFRLNDSAPRVVREVLLERGWEEFNEQEQALTEWNLHWRTSAFRASDHDHVKPWQRLNHHPRTAQMMKKDCLARHLKRMKGIYGPANYEFSPEAFILPNEYTKFLAEYMKEKHNKKSSYWICKPTDLSRGRGIFVFRDIKDLAYDCAVIVQKYITNPLLISGYKFDLRIYVCVTCFCPLTIYVYQEGLVRFATEKFSLSCLDNIFAHLTNTSINKYSTSYTTEKERVGSGCKWTFAQFRSYLRGIDVDDAMLWQKIYNIVTMTLLAIASSVTPSSNCFELLGFDILIDETLKPWLLEVNYSPALSLDCSNDVIVKKSLINDIIELLNFKPSDGLRDASSIKKSSMTPHVLHSCSHTSCESVNSQRTEEIKPSSYAKDYSTENKAPNYVQSVNSKTTHPDTSPRTIGDSETKRSVNEICCKCDAEETSFQDFPDDTMNKRVTSNGITGSSPRKTLTSRLRERMNVSQRLADSKVISKTHPVRYTRIITTVESARHYNQWKPNEYNLFPLYFISDLDKSPPSHVGNFLLVFPFSQSSLLASRNGMDIKSIIQELSRIMHRLSSSIKSV